MNINWPHNIAILVILRPHTEKKLRFLNKKNCFNFLTMHLCNGDWNFGVLIWKKKDPQCWKKKFHNWWFTSIFLVILSSNKMYVVFFTIVRFKTIFNEFEPWTKIVCIHRLDSRTLIRMRFCFSKKNKFISIILR